MNNETNTTFDSISNNTTEPPLPSSHRDPWSFVHGAYELPTELSKGPDVSANAAFVVFTILTITSLLVCTCITMRQSKQISTTRKSPNSSCGSCTCRLLLFSFLIAGFSLLSAYSAQQSTLWFIDNNNTHHSRYTHFGKVRIVDTNISFHNGSVTALESTTTSQEDYFDAQVLVARAQVVFGGEWACGNDKSNVVCETVIPIPNCFQIVCQDSISECSAEEQQAANASATSCLANVTGDYDMPILVSMLNLSISPLEYPDAPLLGMYNIMSFSSVCNLISLSHTFILSTFILSHIQQKDTGTVILVHL